MIFLNSSPTPLSTGCLLEQFKNLFPFISVIAKAQGYASYLTEKESEKGELSAFFLIQNCSLPQPRQDANFWRVVTIRLQIKDPSALYVITNAVFHCVEHVAWIRNKLDKNYRANTTFYTERHAMRCAVTVRKSIDLFYDVRHGSVRSHANSLNSYDFKNVRAGVLHTARDTYLKYTAKPVNELPIDQSGTSVGSGRRSLVRVLLSIIGSFVLAWGDVSRRHTETNANSSRTYQNRNCHDQFVLAQSLLTCRTQQTSN